MATNPRTAGEPAAPTPDPCNGEVVESNIPQRLDRLPWSRWHVRKIGIEAAGKSLESISKRCKAPNSCRPVDWLNGRTSPPPRLHRGPAFRYFTNQLVNYANPLPARP